LQWRNAVMVAVVNRAGGVKKAHADSSHLSETIDGHHNLW
jgi:hypothetical protein